MENAIETSIESVRKDEAKIVAQTYPIFDFKYLLIIISLTINMQTLIELQIIDLST